MNCNLRSLARIAKRNRLRLGSVGVLRAASVGLAIQFCQLAFCQPSNSSSLCFIYNVVTTPLMLHILFLSPFRCVCNIDCSQTNFNPLCASDGKSYDNACQIKEASCQKQEKIEVMSLGRCQGNTHTKIHFKEYL